MTRIDRLAIAVLGACACACGRAGFQTTEIGDGGDTTALPLSAPCPLSCTLPDVCGNGACGPAILVAAFAGNDEPVIDGEGSESVYSAATPVTFTDKTGTSDNVTTVRAAWTDSALYLLYEVFDARLATQVNPCPCKDDGIEVLIDTSHDRAASMRPDDYHVIGTIDGQLTVGVGTAAGSEAAAGFGVDWDVAYPDGGFRYELRFPFAPTGVTPVAGQVMGLLLAQNDLDAAAARQYDWLMVVSSGSFTRPNTWGELRLGAP